MKLIATITVCSFLWSSLALGQCKKPVTLLDAGEAAPCRGYLFSPEKELELRLLNEDYKFLTEKLNLKDQQLDLYQQQTENYKEIAEAERQKSELWRKAAEDSTQQLMKKEERQETRDWLFLLSGIGLTVLAGWALGQASK